MSHHGREGEPRWTDDEAEDLSRKLNAALYLIGRIVECDVREHNALSLQRMCDEWCSENGYENGEDRRARAGRNRRAEELDAEIARLRAERAKL